MIYFIIGYLAGLATVISSIVIMNRRLEEQRCTLMNRMDQTVAFESNKAYQCGRQQEARVWAEERDNLMYQINALQSENDAMRERLDSRQLFSQAYQQNGNAVIYIKNGRREYQ